MRRLLLILLAVSTVWACKTEEELINAAALNYLEAEYKHQAPYRAYSYIARDDKEFIDADDFGAFDRGVEAELAATAIEVRTTEATGNRATVQAEVQPAEGDSIVRDYVLVQEDGRWRVWLGLAKLAAARTKLDKARTLADAGDVEEAKDTLEAVANTPFRASRPDIRDTELAAVRNAIANRKRWAEIDRKMRAAESLEVGDFAKELDAIDKLLRSGDDELMTRQKDMRQKLHERRRQKFIADFKLTGVKVRRSLDEWGVLKEPAFRATNNTGFTLTKLVVHIEFLNEEGGEPLGFIAIDVVTDATPLKPDATVQHQKEAKDAPKGWKGRLITASVKELEFDDGSDG